MLMSCNGLEESFSVGKAAEVEGGSPAILVEVGREIVVTVAILVRLPMPM